MSIKQFALAAALVVTGLAAPLALAATPADAATVIVVRKQPPPPPQRQVVVIHREAPRPAPVRVVHVDTSCQPAPQQQVVVVHNDRGRHNGWRRDRDRDGYRDVRWRR